MLRARLYVPRKGVALDLINNVQELLRSKAANSLSSVFNALRGRWVR